MRMQPRMNGHGAASTISSCQGSALVLATRPVLGKQADEVRAANRHVDTAGSRDRVHRVAREAPLQERLRASDDPGILPIENDAKPLGSRSDRASDVRRAAPVADRSAGDPEPAGDLAVVQALLDQGQGGGADLRRVHVRNLRGKVCLVGEGSADFVTSVSLLAHGGFATAGPI